MANSLRACFELADFKVDFSGEYPGWLPNMNSSILKTLENSDMELEGTKVIDYTSREVGVIKVKHNKFTLLDMTKKDDQYLAKGSNATRN